MNSVNCSDLKCPKRSGKQYKSFIYTGGLHLDRWRGLLDIGKVLKEYNPGSTLKIYTSIFDINLVLCIIFLNKKINK